MSTMAEQIYLLNINIILIINLSVNCEHSFVILSGFTLNVFQTHNWTLSLLPGNWRLVLNIAAVNKKINRDNTVLRMSCQLDKMGAVMKKVLCPLSYCRGRTGLRFKFTLIGCLSMLTVNALYKRSCNCKPNVRLSLRFMIWLDTAIFINYWQNMWH